MGAMDKRLTIGIKSGTFTLIHPGHIFMLAECKKQCDFLIVLLNDDDYVFRKKGVIPIPLEGRKRILESICYVDRVAHFSGDNEDQWIRDFYSKNKESVCVCKLVVFHSIETQGKSFIPGASYADEIIYIPRITGSTTEIFQAIRENRKWI